MPINPDLLVMAPVLQDYLVDKDGGLPLANGVITLYQDNSRTTLKNWYYQSGSAGAYTYITLPNPMTLSGAGTTQDGNGNDILPMYYPYDENSATPLLQTYYITVDNANGERQFTRQNFPFPFVTSGSEPSVTGSTNKNLIVNNVFWRNIGTLDTSTPLSQSTTINGITYYFSTIAPSQHDGYTMSDIQYFKNANDGTDVISFNEFVAPSLAPTFEDQVLQNTVTPEFYLNFNCSSAGSSTTKYIQFPLSLHVRSLSGYLESSLTFQAMAVGGSSSAVLGYRIFQFLGSGVLSPITLPTFVPLNETWTPYTVSLPLPSSDSLLPSGGGVGDDAFYVQFIYPTATTFNINLAVPGFYLSNEVPDDDFSTYDEVNAIISSPRTGDIRTSLNSFSPFGWVPMNDGTIGSPTSGATTRANNDTWQLYRLIYNSVLDHWAPVIGGRNISNDAYTDFAVNNRPITLTRSLGRVLAGQDANVVTSLTFTKSNYSSDHFKLTISSSSQFKIGDPVQVFGGSLPSSLSANTVYFAIPNGATGIDLADTVENAYLGFPIDLGSNGSGTIQSALGAYVGESLHSLTGDENGPHVHNAVNSNSGYEFLVTAGIEPGIIQGGVGIHGRSQRSTDTSGLGAGHNTIQPSTYMNVFIKL